MLEISLKTYIMATIELEKKKKLVPPCQYTLEELIERLKQAEEDVKNGRTIPHEEVKKTILEWRLNGRPTR